MTKRRLKIVLWAAFWVLFVALVIVVHGCRSPFPPATGSGYVYFEESPEVRVTVRDCTRSATYTVALRQAIEAAEPQGDLVLIFHRGPSRYLGRSGGRGYAMVQCEDWAAVPGLIQEHNRELVGP